MTSVQPVKDVPSDRSRKTDYHGQSNQGYHQQTHHQTVVITSQPTTQFKVKREWRTDKFACCDDMTICLCVTFFAPCYGCHLAMEAEETCCLACCCQGWIVPMRSYVRGKLGIQGTVCKDICAAACCNCCVTCQLAREIKLAKSSGEWYTT